VKEAIERTVKQFQKHPLDFLSECDIQAWLFAELRFPDATRDLRFQHDAANPRFELPDTFSVHHVTTEYHVPPEGRFDVAVLSEKTDPTSDIWRQPCCIGIEIKLWQPCEKEPKYLLDIAKLQRYWKMLQIKEQKFMGIAMLFVNPHKTGKPKDIFEDKFGGDYPENGVALHLVTQENHWSKQFPTPAVPELKVVGNL
jgi:hypothetical protein